MNQIRLIEDQYNNKLIFQFLNGTIELRGDQFGAYAMCPGCGAGKTTIIKQLIALKWYEGILYAAFTQNELNEMYQFCITLVGSRYIDRTGVEHVLKLEDIVVLHSDYSKAGTNKDLWENRPRELMSKRIILCTHDKLLNEPMHLLIRSDFTPGLDSLIGPDSACTKPQGNLPRQWLLIDESTEANSITFKLNRLKLLNLGTKYKYKQVVVRDDLNRPIYTRVPCDAYWAKTSTIYSDFIEDINDLVESSDEFRDELYGGIRGNKSTELYKLRKDQLHSALYKDYDTYVNMNTNTINVSYSYTNIIEPGMNTHLILFDGTSDITLSTSKKFEVLLYDKKYNSQVNLARFPFSMDRRLKLGPNTDANLYLKNQVSNLADNLVDIIKQNNKTLIFTWLDIKTTDVEINDDNPMIGNDDVIVRDVSGIIKNKPIVDFYKILEMELESRGFEVDKDFSIEYYGSGKDKAVNTYRDYDAIVLCGRYRVPNSTIVNSRLMYDSNITATEYYANRVVQAICRTRIRLHNYMPINVYMSSDWSPEVVNYVARYFNTTFNVVELNSNIKYGIDRMQEGLRTKGLTPKKAEQISKLSHLNNLIYDSIMNNTPYSCQLRLDDVFNILPMSRKEVDKYKRIIDSLKDYGINIEIL